MDLRHNDCIDAVLNFQEVEAWLRQEQIEIAECEPEPFQRIDPKVNRLYPVTNGVVNSVLATEKQVGSLPQILCPRHLQLYRFMREHDAG